MPLLAPEEPAAKSLFSTSATDSPRMAASRAMPVPLTPPPMTRRSCTRASIAVLAARRKRTQIQRVEVLMRAILGLAVAALVLGGCKKQSDDALAEGSRAMPYGQQSAVEGAKSKTAEQVARE